jgi:class 3 adenylate cyclase/tetratricopeptide (TPR) repeat protein
MTCGVCGLENAPGRKFCGECGAPLERACPACGAANEPAMKFCGECGAALTAEAPRSVQPTPVAERRLVTVLFADLVGYTALSESRDFEDVRELQSHYFDTARTVIDRYGGVLEKFIGDAVMAVWGAPVAREDDAERAVRAALELVDAVAALGGDVPTPALSLRAGVLTGEAAVTVGAVGQGLVTGDLVNSASRIQSAAEPGAVLVGEGTRRSTEASIAYLDAGEHALKGKSEPVRLWRALRVIANRGGEGRSVGVEAPFVGRDRELRLAKELFHATADDHTARLLSVVGVAGIGKSRLAWEFEKYVDGLADDVYWHKGRCLAYGDGVAYWALAEMIRGRARILEDEAPETALPKLREVVAELVQDDAERAFVEPRLQHLLGLTERTAPDREDLFSAWRLFVERMADRLPVIMLFEDLHWADAALVEFVETLLERSRRHPIFVLAFSRPELTERHSGWGAKLRNLTSIHLDELSEEAIDLLLRGLVPGLPSDAAARIRERAEGIPFYAVETVRMLLDRGLLEPGKEGYRVTGDLGSLQVPETLQTLIAARLDGLEPQARRLLQDASVLGKTFTVRGLAALSGLDEDNLRPQLDGLTRKELLVLETDPLSPERGQYGFLQALVQRVAYETLSRRDRKARHVAAAKFLAEQAGMDPDEIAEVIASHYRDAVRADEAAEDAPELQAAARGWLERAGDRAASLAASEEALRAYEAAAELAGDPQVEAGLLERAGDMARMGGRLEDAERFLFRARDLYAGAGKHHAAARATAGIARVAWVLGRLQDAVTLAEDAYAVLSGDTPDADVGALAAELGRLHFFAGDGDLARARVEKALDIAEATSSPALLSRALNTKAMTLMDAHPHEGHALYREALTVALAHDLVWDALRAYNNLAIALDLLDRAEDLVPLLEEARELARRRGDGEWEQVIAATMIAEYTARGRWDEARSITDGLSLTSHVAVIQGLAEAAEVEWLRGQPESARALLVRISRDEAPSPDFQRRVTFLMVDRVVAQLDGRPEAVVELAAGAIRSYLTHPETGLLLATEVRALASTGFHAGAPDVDASVLAELRSAYVDRAPRPLTAQIARLEAVLAARAGDHGTAVERFGVALAAARSLDFEPWVAEILADYAASLLDDGRPEDAVPLLEEARSIAEPIGWVRLLDRLASLDAESAPVVETGAGSAT